MIIDDRFDKIKSKFELYGYEVLTSREEYINSNILIDFKDAEEYKYRMTISSFSCTIRANSRPLKISKYNFYAIENLKLFLDSIGCRHKLISDKLTFVKGKVKFFCIDCEREFDLILDNIKIRKVANCPFCAHKIIIKENSIFHYCPDLLKEWDFNKNLDVDINSIACNSKKEFWWICSKCGNNWEWSAFNKYENFGTTGCPKCNIKVLSEDKNLLASPYDLESIWDYKKNYPLIPIDIFMRSGKLYWWYCKICKYEWQSNCDKMHRMKGCCPKCSGSVISDKNSLVVCRPDIAQEWNYKKNKGIDINSIFVTSGKKYWWLCDLGHEWESTVANRNKHNSGCPICSESQGEKRIRKFLIKNKIKNKPQYKFVDCRKQRVLPFDFAVFINKNLFIIEYHGGQHYKPVERFGGVESFELQIIKDKIKSDYCKNNNIPMITIPYWDFDNIEEILTKELNL